MPTFTAFQYIHSMKQIYLILLLIFATACKEVFEAPPQALLQATLLNSNTGGTTTPTVSIRGIGIEPYLFKDTTLSALYLPLSANNVSGFLITFDSISDTVTFTYDTSLKYASMESGFYNEYKLRRIVFSKNKIDSILIADSLVTKTLHENIKLYIHP
jgi:hypothetical protein